VLLLATLFGMFPFLLKLYADGGYQGPDFQQAVANILRRINVDIVKRSDHARGFVVLPKRWIVERTLAWLNRCRRLAKDWENLNRKALEFGGSFGNRIGASTRRKWQSKIRHRPPQRPSGVLLWPSISR